MDPPSPSQAASVTLNASGQLIFTPTLNYNGTPSFTYTVTSGGVTETATVNLTISPINDAPVANDDGSFPITGGTPLTINVIANDTDVENDPLTVTHIIDPAAPATPIALTTNVAVTLASGTTVTRLASGQLQVAIPLAATGTETFSYRLSDGSLTDDAVVTLTRNSGNSAPTAVDDTFTGNEDGSITGDVTPGTVGQDSDLDGHTLTIVDVDGNALNGITPVAAPSQRNTRPQRRRHVHLHPEHKLQRHRQLPLSHLRRVRWNRRSNRHDQCDLNQRRADQHGAWRPDHDRRHGPRVLGGER